MTAPRPSPPQPVLNGAAGFVCWSRGFLEVAGAESRAELLESLKGYCSQGGNPPLLLFPEEATTNGRVGLLRFRWAPRGKGVGALPPGARSPAHPAAPSLCSSWPFSIVDAVQPLALQVWRPFVAVVSLGPGGGLGAAWLGLFDSPRFPFPSRAWLALPGSLSCSGLSSFLSPFIK